MSSPDESTEEPRDIPRPVLMHNENENATEDVDRRARQYQYLQAHGFRYLYHTIDMYRKFPQMTDEEIAARPNMVRVVFQEILDEADNYYQAMLGAWEVSDEHLDDYVRMVTKPEWKKLMEDSGMRWSYRRRMWMQKDDRRYIAEMNGTDGLGPRPAPPTAT